MEASVDPGKDILGFLKAQKVLARAFNQYAYPKGGANCAYARDRCRSIYSL